MPLKLKETNISNEHNRLKNPNWREADQLAIYNGKSDFKSGALTTRPRCLLRHTSILECVIDRCHQSVMEKLNVLSWITMTRTDHAFTNIYRLTPAHPILLFMPQYCSDSLDCSSYNGSLPIKTILSVLYVELTRANSCWISVARAVTHPVW